MMGSKRKRLVAARMAFGFLVFVPACGAAPFASAASAEPIVTLHYGDDLGPLADKRVRFHGVIDECTQSSCSICPDWATLAKTRCYWISNWRDDIRGRLMDELYRFSEVTITASVVRRQPEPKGIIVDCFGPERVCGVDLFDVVVEDLTARRPAAEVELPPNPGNPPLGPMLPVDARTDADLRALFGKSDALRDLLDLKDRANVRTFVYRYDQDILEGYLCARQISEAEMRSDTMRTEIRWPARPEDFQHSPANPYVCWKAMRSTKEPWAIAFWMSWGLPPG